MGTLLDINGTVYTGLNNSDVHTFSFGGSISLTGDCVNHPYTARTYTGGAEMGEAS